MDEIAVALISLAVSTIVSMMLNLLIYYQNNRTHYSTTISKERMDWIKETKKIAAEFIAICESNETIESDKLHEFYKLKNLLLLNLNKDDRYKNDITIISAIENASFDEIKRNLSKIRTAFSDIFKSEWDKAKMESGRTLFNVKELDRVDKKLNEYYANVKK